MRARNVDALAARHAGKTTVLSGVFAALLAGAMDAHAAEAHDAAVEQAVAVLCDKQVAVLAELPSHGEREGFQLKARVAQGLVQRCGFNQLLFEAPVYDFIELQVRLADGTAVASQLDRSIGRFWWMRELAVWRRWMFQEAQADRLVIGGLDDQVSVTSEHAQRVLPGLVARHVPQGSAARCQVTVDRHLQWGYDEAVPFDRVEQTVLDDCTREAAANALGDTPRDELRADAFMLANFANSVRCQVDREGATDRSTVFFDNMRWHLHGKPMSTKTVVWTATVHGTKRNGSRKAVPLGTHMWQSYGERMGVVATKAHAGTWAMAGTVKGTHEAAPAGSLEAMAVADGVAVRFIDSASLRKMGPVPSRLLGDWRTHDWSTLFDGVIVVRDEAPPTPDFK